MSEYYQVITTEPGFYRIISKEYVFSELIVGQEKAMLIDTGYAYSDLKSVVRSVTDKPLIIVNTHGHLDHVSGNCQFDETVYISKEDLGLAKYHTAPEFRKFSIACGKHANDYETGQIINVIPEDFDEEQYLHAGVGKLATCKEGDLFDLGGICAEVIATPGHTGGGLSFFFREKKWLYAGDEIGGFVWLFLEESTDLNTHIETLKKVRALEPVCIWGSHSPYPITLKHLERYIQAAESVDFDKGIPFEQKFPGQVGEIRICMLDDCSMEQLGTPDFAAIVVSNKKL